MIKVRTTVTGKQVWTPVDVKLEFTIETRDEAQHMLDEFIEGNFQEIETQYSDIVYKVLRAVEDAAIEALNNKEGTEDV